MNCTIKSIIVDVAKNLDIDTSGSFFNDSDIYSKLIARLSEEGMSVEPDFVQALSEHVKRYCLKNLVDGGSISKTVKGYFTYNTADGKVQFDFTSYRDFMQYAARRVGDSLILNIFNDATGEYEVIDSKEKLQKSLEVLLCDLSDVFGDTFATYGNRINDAFKENLNSIDKREYYQYILLLHNRELIPEISNHYIRYNYTEENFEINDGHHHVAGWERKDDRSAYDDTSGSLKLLIESTPLYDIFQSKNGRRTARQTKKNLTAAMFYEASNTLLNFIARNDWAKFRKIIENPRLLVDEIISYTDSLETINSNIDKILYSIRTRYFDSTGAESGKVSINLVDAYKKSFSKTIKSDGINYLDTMLAGMLKYVKQTYQRYNWDEGRTTSTDVLNKGVISLQMANNIDYVITKQGIPKVNGKKLLPKDIVGLTTEALLYHFKNLTGFDFLQFKNQDLPLNDIITLLTRITTGVKINGDDANLVALAKYYLDKNPEIIKSITSRSDGNKVPNYRLANLSNTFYQHLANLQNRIESSPTGSESPLMLSFLYNNPTLYKESRLHLDAFSKIKKKFRLAEDFTDAEQLQVAIGWDYNRSMKDNGEILIEGITPSDKKSIMYQVFDTTKAIEGLGEGRNKSIAQASWKEIADFFREGGLKIQTKYLENSLNLFERVLNITPADNYIDRINNIDFALTGITVDQLNNLVDEYNAKNYTNYVISNEFDYKKVKGSGIKFNRLLYGYYLAFANTDTFFDNEYNLFLKDCREIFRTGDIMEAFKNRFGMTQDDVKKYFYTHALLSYNYILLTVGSTIAHKYKNPAVYSKPLKELTVNDFVKNTEQSYVTSTKRMVALSATGHAYQRGILTGLPNTANYATISDYNSPVADLNKSAGQEMNVWDGAVFAPITTLWLSDNSTVDYKVEGIVRKTLGHAMIEGKGVATLNKSATFGISNAFMLKNIHGRFKLKEMLRQSYTPADFFYGGRWFDITKNFNGKRTSITGYYQINEPGKGLQVFKVSNLKWKGENNYTYNLENLAEGTTEIDIPVTLSNLWDVYKLLGAEFSGEIITDEYGGDTFVYSEASQHQILNLLNSIGVKTSVDGSVLSQADVDQFLKKKMIHYFPTESTNKSAQLPITSNDVFRGKSLPLHVIGLDISNTAVQLDADHAVDDAEVSEPTQLISFMAQKGLVQSITKEIYTSLANLIKSTSSQFVNSVDNRAKLVDIFGKGLVKTFLKDNVDVLGLAQALMEQINEKIQANPGVSLEDLGIAIPFSDENLMGKIASDVVIYTNGFIKRKYAGSADVMVPSYDILMLFEDETGRKYNSLDLIKNPEIYTHLQEIDNKEVVDPLALEFGNIYYLRGSDGLYHDLEGTSSSLPIPVELNSYEEYLRIQEGLYNITKCYIKPRNLKGRNVFVNVRIQNEDGTTSDRKINIFSLGLRYALEYDTVKDPEATRTFMNNVLYKAISEGKVDILNKNRGFIAYDPSGDWKQLPIVEILGTEYVNSEISTSYKYSSVLNIPAGVSIDEIRQGGPEWFKERILINRKVVFPDGMIPSEFVLKSNTGAHLPIYFNKEFVSEFLTDDNKITVPTDDTGIYRINDRGEDLYKIEGLEFYKVNGTEVAVIVDQNNPMQILDNILQSGLYSGYDGNVNSEVNKLMKRNRIFKVNEDFINDLANRQYNSFWETLKYIVARIPAQSEQFAMPCEIVDIFQSPYNVSLVNKYQTYEQGSDYDVDKNNNLGVALTDDGVYPAWSIFWDYNDLESSKKLPLPDPEIIYGENKGVFVVQYTGTTPYYGTEGDDNPNGWTNKVTDFIDLTADLLEAYTAGDKLTVNSPRLRNLISKVRNRDIVIDISKFPVQSKSSNELFNDVYVWDTYTVAELQKLGWQLATQINRHNTHKIPKRTLDKVFMNNLVNNMFNTYHNVSTIGYATLPTTVEPIEKAAAVSPKSSDNFSPFVSTSQIKMNSNNKVGKEVIGIVASAIKAEYAIEYWISSGNAKLIGKTITWPGIAKEFTTTHSEFFANYGTVAITLSSLLSQATDNAKNPILNNINCTSETAPGIIWMIMTGADLNDIVTIFTDDIMTNIISMVKGNMFEDIDSVSITTAISQLLKVTDTKSEAYQKLLFYQEVFKGAGELTLLARELSVNQGLSTEFGAIVAKRINFEQGIERIVNAKIKADSIFGGSPTVKKYTTGRRFTFDKIRFFNDSRYANDMIRIFQQCATTINVLDVLKTSPHFYEMDFLSINAERAIGELSGKYRAIVEQMNRTKLMTDKQLVIPKNTLSSRLRSLATDDMIVQAIKSLDFKYPSNVEVDRMGGVHPLNEVILRSINSPVGLKNFVIFVNETLIPSLRLKYPTNFFLNNLIADRKYSTSGDGFVRYYKPMFNLIEKTNQDYYEKMLIDFNLIANDVVYSQDLGEGFININDDNWPNNTVADYIFLYNLIVNKNQILGDSFSKLFTEVIKNNTLINSYFDFVGRVYDKSFVLDKTLAADFETLYQIRKSNYDDEFMDDSYMEDFDEGPSAKPQNVFPLNNERFKALNRGAAKQLTSERKLNVALNRGLLIIKSC